MSQIEISINAGILPIEASALGTTGARTAIRAFSLRKARGKSRVARIVDPRRTPCGGRRLSVCLELPYGVGPAQPARKQVRTPPRVNWLENLAIRYSTQLPASEIRRATHNPYFRLSAAAGELFKG